MDSINASINATPANGKTTSPIIENTAYNISPTSKSTNNVIKNSTPFQLFLIIHYVGGNLQYALITPQASLLPEFPAG